MTLQFTFRKYFLALVAIFSASLSYAECRDLDSMNAANEAAIALLNGEVFLPARVLKKHHPSEVKEVASYIKAGDLYYTVFSNVNAECIAVPMKRTNGKY